MKNFEIRVAKLEDAPGIAKVHVETWQCAYKGQIPASYLDTLSVEQRTNSWEHNLSHPESKSETFIAIKDDQILGFCIVGPSRDDNVTPSVGEIYAIYVDSSHQGEGIGTEIIKKGLEYLKTQGFSEATLWVLISNTDGRKFYEKRGWEVEKETKSEVVKGFELKEVRYKIKF